MDRLDAIKVFVRVVESGSFSAVAREVGVGQPAVSRQIAGLEQHLGAQLLTRTSRSLSLTEAGRDFYESAVRLIGDLEAAESRVGRGQASPSGVLRVTVAPGFGRLYVVPRLPDFFRQYPDVAVELLVTDRPTNLVEEGIDLAIRNGELPDSTLVSRRIGATPVVTVASNTYLTERGEPDRPEALNGHDCITFVSSQGGPRRFRFEGKFGGVEYAALGAFRTNDAEQIRSAVLAGLGVAQAPLWLFADDIAAGQVRCILTDYQPADIPIGAVRPARRLAGKVSVFTDFLAACLQETAETAG